MQISKIFIIKHIFIIAILVSVSVFSCSYFNNGHSEQPLAKVYDAYLYPSDLQGVIPCNLSIEDSINMVKDYIQRWVEQTVLANEARKKLPDNKQIVQQRVKDYENSLLIYEYQKQIIEQKLDTTISEDELKTFYNNNKQLFLLKQPVLQVDFIKVNKQAPQVYQMWNWYKYLDNESIKDKVIDYCQNHADTFSIARNQWITFTMLQQNVPLSITNEAFFFKHNLYTHVQDSTHHYFMYFRDYELTDSVAPLPYIRDKVAQIIINKHKQELIEQLTETIFTKAYNFNKVEVYY